MHQRRHTALLAVGIASTLIAAACSGGGSSREGGDPTPSSTEPAVTAAILGEVASSDPVPSGGCGTSVVATVSDEQVYLDDSDRSFQFTTPPSHDGDTPVPLVLDFHGLAEGATVHTLMTEMGAFGARNGFAVAIPQGLGDPARWETALQDNADLDFVDQMLDQIEATACIDTSRVYATGLSNGAFLSSVLACTSADRFAAIAPVAGVLYPEGCDPDRPVPVLAFHGTDDEILLFNSGVGEKLGEIMGRLGPSTDEAPNQPDQDTESETGENGDTGESAETGGATTDEKTGLSEVPEADLSGEGFPAAAQAWADRNGCESAPSDRDLTETVIERTWDCPAAGAVEFLIIRGGGHTWPGSEFSQNLVNVMGVTDTSIDANEQIWAFFQRFALPAA